MTTANHSKSTPSANGTAIRTAAVPATAPPATPADPSSVAIVLVDRKTGEPVAVCGGKMTPDRAKAYVKSFNRVSRGKAFRAVSVPIV